MKKANKQDPIKNTAEGFLDYLTQQIDSKEADEAKLHEGLDEVLENEWNLTGEAKFRAKELFHTAVQNNASRFQQRLATLVGQYSPLLEDVDVVERLSNYIQKLETEIEHYDAENEKLAAEQISKLSENYQLSESVVSALWNNSSDFDELNTKSQQTSRPEKTPKKSWVEEDMEALNESDLFSNGGEEYIDPAMRHYLKALGHK